MNSISSYFNIHQSSREYFESFGNRFPILKNIQKHLYKGYKSVYKLPPTTKLSIISSSSLATIGTYYLVKHYWNKNCVIKDNSNWNSLKESTELYQAQADGWEMTFEDCIACIEASKD